MAVKVNAKNRIEHYPASASRFTYRSIDGDSPAAGHRPSAITIAVLGAHRACIVSVRAHQHMHLTQGGSKTL